MNIFITGARGFIGTAFLAALEPRLEGSGRAFCLSRTPPQKSPPRVSWLRGDLADIAAFKEELLDADYVCHIAGEPDLAAGAESAAVNYTSTRDILGLLKGSSKLKKFVYISSIAAAGRRGRIEGPLKTGREAPPESHYGRSKLKAEQETIASGLPYLILRPGFVYGPGMRPGSHINRFVSLAVRRSPLARLAFPGKLSLIHADDLAAAISAAASEGAPEGRTYFAQTETATAGEVFALIRSALGLPRGAQIPLPRVNGLPGPLRSLLPLGAASLLSDYFWAEDDRFMPDLLPRTSPRLLADNIAGVIRTNQDFILSGGPAAAGERLR